MSEWDELSAPSVLPDVTRDVPLGYCWFCRRRIDVTSEAWRPLPHDLMAPWRRPGEGDEAYLTRVVTADEHDEGDDGEEA